MKKTKKAKKVKKPKQAESAKVTEPKWGACEVCGEVIAWPGANVSCDGQGDDGEGCDGVYFPSDENGSIL